MTVHKVPLPLSGLYVSSLPTSIRSLSEKPPERGERHNQHTVHEERGHLTMNLKKAA